MAAAKFIRVVIVEDDQDIRDSMVELLPATGEILCIRSYERAEELLKEIDRLMVDVVLMDISLIGGMDGIQAVRQAKAKRPDIQYLMCTSHNDATRTFDSLCAGASGYILKTAKPDQLIQAVKEIYSGGSPMSPEIARLVVSSFNRTHQNQNLLNELTTREQEIVHALAKGLSYQEIADSLFISIETVRTYLRKIYEKLQVHSKVEALNKLFPR
ncbi:MAG: response regulator transcription factor [Saprospiraceae bacterium]|nr:response regulator transcription factor [Saprospiraceae bacterium]